MKKSIILPVVLGVISLALAVASFVLLPEKVVTQLSIGGSGVTTMPKLLAVSLPTLLGVGGAVAAAFSKEKSAGKALIVSAVGVLVFAIMLIVNL